VSAASAIGGFPSREACFAGTLVASANRLLASANRPLASARFSLVPSREGPLAGTPDAADAVLPLLSCGPEMVISLDRSRSGVRASRSITKPSLRSGGATRRSFPDGLLIGHQFEGFEKIGGPPFPSLISPLRQRRTIGQYPIMPLKEAREAALEALRISRGEERPSGARKRSDKPIHSPRLPRSSLPATSPSLRGRRKPRRWSGESLLRAGAKSRGQPARAARLDDAPRNL